MIEIELTFTKLTGQIHEFYHLRPPPNSYYFVVEKKRKKHFWPTTSSADTVRYRDITNC